MTHSKSRFDPAAKSPRTLALALFLLSLVVFNANLRPISSGDTAPAALIPFNLLLNGSFQFDKYEPALNRIYDGRAYFLVEARGRHYSLFPVFHAVLATPLYAPALLVPGIREFPFETLLLLARVLEKLAASLFAAAAVGVFFLLADRLARRRIAILTTVVFAFATNTWSTASQALWQHGPSQLALLLSLLFLHRYLTSFAMREAWAAAAFAAFSVAMRPTNAFFFAISAALLPLFTKRRELLKPYLVCGAAVALGLMAFNFALFADVRGGYSYPLDSRLLRGGLLMGVAGMLVSPGRGLFFYSPVLLFAVPGAWIAWRKARPDLRPLIAISCLFAIAHTAVHAKAVGWGGHCFGPRYMTDVLPLLTLLLAPALEAMRGRLVLNTVFALTLTASMSIQFLGTFSYPNGQWDTAPAPIDDSLHRFWDWRDNPIRRCASAGLSFKGYQMAWSLIAGKKSAAPELHVQ